VAKELSRPTSVGWYRNPPRQSVDSLGIAYRDEVGNWRSMHPDFVFFNEIDGAVLPSIVDPHGHHLEDSLVKLQGLAKFAKTFGDKFHRMEAVTKLANSMRILDLKIPAVRDATLRQQKAPDGALRVRHRGRLRPLSSRPSGQPPNPCCPAFRHQFGDFTEPPSA
jgi:type III restriction enzyme